MARKKKVSEVSVGIHRGDCPCYQQIRLQQLFDYIDEGRVKWLMKTLCNDLRFSFVYHKTSGSARFYKMRVNYKTKAVRDVILNIKTPTSIRKLPNHIPSAMDSFIYAVFKKGLDTLVKENKEYWISYDKNKEMLYTEEREDVLYDDDII